MTFEPDPQIRCRDYAIGCIGAGMIMAECHLAAYAEAGFKVTAITRERSFSYVCDCTPPGWPDHIIRVRTARPCRLVIQISHLSFWLSFGI